MSSQISHATHEATTLTVSAAVAASSAGGVTSRELGDLLENIIAVVVAGPSDATRTNVTPTSMMAFFTTLQNVSTPPDHPELRRELATSLRMKTLLHFEALDSFAYIAPFDKDNGSQKLVDVKRNHTAFIEEIVQLYQKLFASTFAQLASRDFATPPPAIAVNVEQMRADGTTALTKASQNNEPLTFLLMRAMPENPERMFGSLVFAWRLQELLAQLPIISPQKEDDTTILLANICRFAKAGANLTMTCEFNDDWILPLTQAVCEFYVTREQPQQLPCAR